MLDIKAFGEEDHLKVTAMPNKNTLENAVFLAKMGKLFEIRTVIVPGLFDIENTIIKAGELLRHIRVFIQCATNSSHTVLLASGKSTGLIRVRQRSIWNS